MTDISTNREEEFIQRIEKLNSGQLAALRRGCGKRDPVDGRCPWLIGLMHGIATEATAFLVASLLAQYSTSAIRIGKHRFNGDFGETWKTAITGKNSESLRRRFHILLDSEFDQMSGEGDLPYRLRQMVRYAAAAGVGLNWSKLLIHIRSWNSPTKWVQKTWARSFFGNERPEGTE